MKTAQHENTAMEITHHIDFGLEKIRAQSQSPDTMKLARNIKPSGVAYLEGEDCSYEPDAQFRLRYPFMLKYPDLAVEISWSQSGAGKKGLEEKMGHLLDVPGGITRTVIGVLLRESTSGALRMSLSLWRYATPYNRVWDWVPIVPGDDCTLHLTLGDSISRDTSAKHFPRADLNTEILIPLGRVYEDAQCSFELWQRQTEKSQEKKDGQEGKEEGQNKVRVEDEEEWGT